MQVCNWGHQHETAISSFAAWSWTHGTGWSSATHCTSNIIRAIIQEFSPHLPTQNYLEFKSYTSNLFLNGAPGNKPEIQAPIAKVFLGWVNWSSRPVSIFIDKPHRLAWKFLVHGSAYILHIQNEHLVTPFQNIFVKTGHNTFPAVCFLASSSQSFMSVIAFSLKVNESISSVRSS